jgi:hypothetical protein
MPATAAAAVVMLTLAVGAGPSLSPGEAVLSKQGGEGVLGGIQTPGYPLVNYWFVVETDTWDCSYTTIYRCDGYNTEHYAYPGPDLSGEWPRPLVQNVPSGGPPACDYNFTTLCVMHWQGFPGGSPSFLGDCEAVESTSPCPEECSLHPYLPGICFDYEEGEPL